VTQISNVGADVDLFIQQGADFASQLTFQNPDASPVNLTGCTLAAMLRRRGLETQLVANFTVLVFAPATAGIATLSLSAAQTAILKCGETPADPDFQYVWDLKFVDSGGKASIPLRGAVMVLRSVTR
jgi:hypothetical protein